MESQRTEGSGDSERSNESDSSPSSAEGALVVVSGPSGVGKSTILRRLADEVDFVFSVSATTRPPRPGEQSGRDYHFLDREGFEEMIRTRAFVEWAEYGGNLYGTPISSIEDARREGLVVVLDIELEGARQVRSLFPDALLIWINPPSFAELERRLIERDDTEADAVSRRLERARRDIALAPSLFDYTLVNDDVDRVAHRIHELVGSHFHSVPQ